jgi:endonuclease-3
MKKGDVQQFFQNLQAENPTPQTELYSVNHFTLLVAVVLSAQATDKSVNKVTESLFERIRTPEELLALGEEAFRESIKTIGLYKTKSAHIIRLCKKLVAEYHSKIPRTREGLESLPGVGRKTANVVLNVAFGEPTFPVDTHIFRVSNRTTLAPGKTPLVVEKMLEQVIPEAFKIHAHHWLILLGRYTCKARKPECWRCVVRAQCGFKDKTAKP